LHIRLVDRRLFMNFTEHGAERNIADAGDLPAGDLPEGTQNREESKRLQDDMRAIDPPERQMILRASARQLGPGAFYRGSGDVPAPISNRQFSPPVSPSSKQKLPVIFTLAVGIASGVAVGVVFGAANTQRLALKVSEVTHSLARLVGGRSGSVAEGTTRTAAPAAIAERIPATRSAAESGGAPLDQVPVPAQTISSNIAPALSAELAQPAAATAEYNNKAGPSGEGENASLPIDRNVSIVANAQPNASSPVAEGQEDDAVLFREFLEWRSNQVKPQAQQQPPLHSSKHGPHVLGSHPTNVRDASIKRTHSSSRTNDLGRHGPPGSKDSERRG
jgi:hypothetical protein